MPSIRRRAPLAAVLATSLAAAPAVAAPSAPPPPGPAGLQGGPPAPMTAAPATDEARDFAGPTEIDTAERTAEELYAEGERAYFLGDYVTAVVRFEAAYDKSQLPQLLYNVGLSYMRRHELTKDAGDLRRARSVLTNFLVELDRDPTIGSRQNVESLLAQINRSLSQVEVAAKAPPAPRTATEVVQPACPEPEPTRTIVQKADTRRAGATLLTLGGLSLAAGAAAGLGFGFKGRQFRSELDDLSAQQSEACADNDASQRCLALTESVAITKSNGHTANILAGTLGGGLTALGVAGLIAGSVLYARSGKVDRRARIQVSPAIGGVWLRGAF